MRKALRECWRIAVPTNNASKAHLIDGKYAVEHLVDPGHLRMVFEKFTEATGFPIGFLAHPGLNVLTASGWRDICAKFHRLCPAAATNCTNSNRHLSDQLNEPGKLAIEECRNGLVDCATPIIVKGKHIATLATGQILIEEPDIERFKRQARLYGFDEYEYLEALRKVPIVSEEKLKKVTAFLGEVALIISELGYSNLLIREEAVHLESEIAKRRQSEEALRESEKLYRLLADNVSDVIWIRDMNMRFTYLSPSATRFTGYTLEEALEKSFEETYTPASLGAARTAFAEELAMEKMPDADPNRTRTLELEGYCKDGSTAWTESKMSFLRAEDGRPVGILGVSRDITERKRAQERLRESEEKYRGLFDESIAAVYLFDEKKNFLDSNRAGLDLLGYSRQELLSMSIPDVDADPTVVLPAHEQLLSGDRLINYEHKLKRKDGKVITVLNNSRPLTDDDGQVVGMQSTLVDITELKQVEKALKESEERHRAVLEASPDPVVIYDMTGRALYLNPAFTRVFGWEAEELLGQRIDFVPEENWPETQRMIDKALSGESFSGIETRRYTKRGDILDISISGAILRDSSGTSLGSVINLRDVTEKKRLEAQLQQAQKMEAVGILAGGIAHDFNNLLQAIMGYAQMIMMDKDQADPDLGKLGEIEKAVRRASELTRQLLTFSRKVESRLRPMDLNQEVRQVQKLLKRTIPKMIGIELHLQERLKVIDADPAQAEQVMMNLCINAKDAMLDGGKLIIETENVILNEGYCKTHLGAVPGEYVLLTISDTGHGMDKETVEHIFEPFFTTKETGKGTGLGLSMVYGILKSHGGFITCYSEPGKGTTFRIYFPALGAVSVTRRAEEEEEEDGLPRGSETILLVDDEDFLRELGKEMLERFGYEVLIADRGESALEIYGKKSDAISLVILDLMMPGIGGKRCLEELLRMNPLVNVVIASGYSINEPIRETLDAGAKGFIGKPYELRQMLSTVRKVLG
jgi:two-component system cell cycle sensor histidine kinase/response regulator CckA